MSKFAPSPPRLEIECWILGVEMSSYWVSLIAMRETRKHRPPDRLYDLTGPARRRRGYAGYDTKLMTKYGMRGENGRSERI